ncbi:flagellar hook-length control protein FliK, partial [Devosia sp.]|uniref:flagellar hook-length control protein FliK n=1 Tax=Devosia sp. TaxID=1871048 RepID=UPI002F144287
RTGAADARAAAAGAESPAEPVTSRPALPQPVVAAASLSPAAAGTDKAAPLAYQPPAQRISLPQVAFELVRQVQAGNSRFQIRLDPPELGRIDVKLDVDQSGNVNARMTVERAETLDLMQRDHRALERALAQAGLDGARTNLEFSLRQNPFARDGGGDGRERGTGFAGPAGGEGSAAGEDASEAVRTLYRGSLRAGGINLFV